MAHGMDHFFTGLQTAFSGTLRDNVTTQLLQKTGIPSQTAGLVDSSLSIAGSLGGLAAIRASQLTTFPNFRLGLHSTNNLHEQVHQSKQNIIKSWPSASSGKQIINGVEYTTHALERMSPRGLIQKGTEIVSRGVPPSAVENAIKFGIKSPGNTSTEMVHIFANVRVVTNAEGTKVITVITTGR